MMNKEEAEMYKLEPLYSSLSDSEFELLHRLETIDDSPVKQQMKNRSTKKHVHFDSVKKTN